MLYATVGLLGMAAGIACLYASWRKLCPRHRYLSGAGWVLLALAWAAFIRFAGAEFGTAYAFLLLALLAWLTVLLNWEIRQRKQRAVEDVQFVVPDTRTALRHIALFLIAVPFSAVATALFSVALATLLPWQPVNAMAAVAVMAPVLWGCAACWACADPVRYRPPLWIGAGGLAGALMIYL